MAKTLVRLAVRDWDYLTPLILDDVKSSALQVEVHRVNTLLGDLEGGLYHAGEFSFSSYARGRAQGKRDLFGVPHFLMRGFRHRCIITASHSPITKIGQLVGKRIGVTGWPDSGNVWTRAILGEEGIGVDDVHWFAGRLTKDHPVVDRLGGYGRAGRIDAIDGDLSMVDLLLQGALDAVFTPFMPPGFFDAGSGLRFLVPEWRDAEVAQFNRRGYVPGMHILCVKPEMVQEHPWLPQALSTMLDESAQVWLQKRRKYADTTPWLIDELQHTSRALPEDWNSNGLDRNRQMISDFCVELHTQQLTPSCLTTQELFPPELA